RGGLTVEWIALRRAEYAASVHLTTRTDERRANGPAGGDDDRRGPLDVPNAGGGDPSWTRFRRSRRAGRATRRGPERVHGTADVRTADVVGRGMAVGQTRSPTAAIVGVAGDAGGGAIF